MKMLEYGLVLCEDDQDIVDLYANGLMEALKVQGCSVVRGFGYWNGAKETTHTITVCKPGHVGGRDKFMLACLADSYKQVRKQSEVMTFIREIDVVFIS